MSHSRPGRRLLALVAAAALAVSVGPRLLPADAAAAAGQVAVDQVYEVPRDGTWSVRGRGYGHGRGMSQWGAQGAALAGLSAGEILGFYYPGTKEQLTSSRVRVLITRDTTDDLVVEAAPGLRLRDRGDGSSYRLPRDLGASLWRVTVSGAGRNVVDYRAGGTWRRWEPGGRAALAGAGEFRGDGSVTLVHPGGTTTYRGGLRAVAPSAGSAARNTLNIVSLDGYLKGVVPAEVYTSWEPAALRAQAIAARTYAAFERAANRHRYYQICDTTACQVYGGMDAEVTSTNAAVDATTRRILTWQGEPAFTQFSASSGGWTAAGSQPYLVAQRDPYDDGAANPVHDWTASLTARAVERAWPSVGTLQRIRVTARDGNGEWQGRVLSMRLVGSRSTVTVSGDTFRFRFGLRSTWFTLG